MGKISFDEKTTNIEDRLWGAEVIKNLPSYTRTQAFTTTRINQGGKLDRAEKIVDIIENLEGPAISAQLIIDKLNIVGVIPIKVFQPTLKVKIYWLKAEILKVM